MQANADSQLRLGYVSSAEAMRLCGYKHVASIHRLIRDGSIRGKRVGLGRFAPWYVFVWDLIKFFETKGTDDLETPLNDIRLQLRRFVANSLQDGRLGTLADGGRIRVQPKNQGIQGK